MDEKYVFTDEDIQAIKDTSDDCDRHFVQMDETVEDDDKTE